MRRIDAYELIEQLKVEAYDAEHENKLEKLDGLITAMKIIAKSKTIDPCKECQWTFEPL